MHSDVQNPAASAKALVEACEGLLCDMDQLGLLGIDTDTENALYNKVLALKKTLPERDEAQMSLACVWRCARART